ncbi:TIGR02556 family CRISPR-associated protein [Clostridium sp. BJN0001]|uniref:TIGR02556 family CRISPR-associated protein n=1 Tax=Clostridium sp. BJN0001 TaxID=2930219 RepID=UPI001FD2FA7D|nr:TIGR02556 family CRISPR-associated protein [Clostridium sp. BJN0001]
MINSIINIGNFLKKNDGLGEDEFIESMVNKIEDDSVKEVLNIEIMDDGKINSSSEEFYKYITTEALFYQVGKGTAGGGIRADYYKETETKKFDKKIKSALDFCECSESFNEVKSIIYNRISEYGKNFFVIILKNGKTPKEEFKEKFLKKMYDVSYKVIKEKNKCHFCGTTGQCYNTTTFKFYTNDKEIYGNVNDPNKNGVVMCKNCLSSILIGKEYVQKYLTTYWMDKSVMFIPHKFTNRIRSVYEQSFLDDNKKKNFINTISNNEKEVLKALGELDTETDIIFFEKKASKTFYIYDYINSMLPSRFSELSKLLGKYKIYLFNIVKYCTALKFTEKNVSTTFKEKIRLIDNIFNGRCFNRNLFFKRSMLIYKYLYFNKNKSENAKLKFCVSEIGKIYNFMVDVGCIKGGFNIMKEYHNYNELFDENKEYFNTNEKKAWFLVGMAYNYINYKIKLKNKDEDGNIAERSSLDKNFFFAKKFDFRDFISFSNLLNDKISKYKIDSFMVKSYITEAKEYMAKKEDILSTDEAKYIFFWGMDMFFKKDDKDDNENKEEN